MIDRIRSCCSAVCAARARLHVQLAPMERWVWRQRMTLLGLACFGILVHLALTGKVGVDVAFGLILGPVFYWIDHRGRDRQHESLSQLLQSARGGAPGLDLGPLPPLSDLFGKTPAKPPAGPSPINAALGPLEAARSSDWQIAKRLWGAK